MTEANRRQKKYKKNLTELTDKNVDARKVSERYRVMRYVLSSEWYNLMNSLSKESMDEFLKDVLYVDRQIRYATEGYDGEEKHKLAKDKMEALGYTI